MIDATNYKVPAFIVTFIIASYLFYKGIKYKTKDDSYLICRNCEQTFAYKDAKPNFTCPKCDIPLVPLQGYFKRKAWKERQKEKNSNTNA
jgi:rubrerythrin